MMLLRIGSVSMSALRDSVWIGFELGFGIAGGGCSVLQRCSEIPPQYRNA